MTEESVGSKNVRRNLPPMRKARSLIGWLSEQEGAAVLAGHEESATPDLANLYRCQKARRAVLDRAPNVNQKELFSVLPAEASAHIDVLKEHPSGQQAIKEFGEPFLVDLRKVLAVQPSIFCAEARERVAEMGAGNLAGIAEMTLPLPTAESLPVSFDPGRNAWVFASANPNLRVHGHFSAQIAPGMTGFGFVVTLRKSYLQVAGVGGRYFLRDGYHRAFGLLAKGITMVPALAKEYATFDEAFRSTPVLPVQTLFGDRPPFLGDYLDDAFSADSLLPVTNKIVALQALELDAFVST